MKKITEDPGTHSGDRGIIDKEFKKKKLAHQSMGKEENPAGFAGQYAGLRETTKRKKYSTKNTNAQELSQSFEEPLSGDDLDPDGSPVELFGNTDLSKIDTDNNKRKSSKEIINEINDLLKENPIRSVNTCFELIKKGKLIRKEVDKVIDFLVLKKMGGKLALKAAYKSQTAKNRLKASATQKVFVKYDELNMNSTTELTEEGILKVPGKWRYFIFGDLLCYYTFDTPAGNFKGINGIKPPKIPIIKPYTKHSLQLRIEQSVTHYEEIQDKKTGKISQIIKPTPIEVINKLISHPTPRAPKVSGLVSHPIIDNRGRIVEKEGFDADTGLLFEFGGESFKKVPKSLSKIDAEQAVSKIIQILLSEFCFKEHPVDSLYQTAALGLLLTGVVRKVLDKAPGFKIDSSVQGTGKTTLLRICFLCLTGSDLAVSNLSNNREEQKKEILSTLLHSPAMIVYDNIKDGTEVDSPILAQVITSPSFTNRMLGKNIDVTVPTNTLISLNGNNITLSSDLIRRFVTISLTANVEKPENRIFKKKDDVQYYLKNRSEIIRNCLIIINAYFKNGAPLKHTCQCPSSFPQWDEMVRFPLLWATGIDIIEAINVNREDSTEQTSMRGAISYLCKIYKNAPFSATDLLSKISTDSTTNQDEDFLRECLSNMSIKAITSTRSLSAVLKKLIGRIFKTDAGEVKLDYQADKYGNYGKFFIKHVKV